MHHLKFGGEADKIVSAAIESGDNLPDELANPPSIPSELIFYWEAFCDLHSCRNNGMSVGCIPWSAVNEYARRYGISDYEFDDFNYVISKLDSEFIAWCDKKAKQDGKRSR